MSKNLSTPIQYLKGIGPKKAKMFEKLGIVCVEDLLYYFPKRYEDRSSFKAISALKKGDVQTIKAQVLVKGSKRSFRNRRFSIFELVVSDDTGRISCLWFNQPYLEKLFNVGDNVILYGKIDEYKGKLQISSPEFELLDEGESDKDSLSMGCVVPIYALTEGLTQRIFRGAVKLVLDEFLTQVKDALPYDIRKKYSLLNLAKSLINIHFPTDITLRESSYRRLAFEEFFLYQLPVLLRKHKSKRKKGISHQINQSLLDKFKESLNFKLTSAQEKVLKEIKQDMSLDKSMQRLLQGEVGSGKTVVACFACLIAISNGYQAAFMAPTEILARQHYQNLLGLIKKLKKQMNFKISLLTSSLDKKAKGAVCRQIKSGKIHLIIGTHSLIQKDVNFKNLGLAVIDEQHKFGVSQRAILPKKGSNPDVLIMTATPIPRTLSLTIYGDLDISCLDELPSGRLPIQTRLYNQAQRREVYKFIESQIEDGRQSYIVYPVIEESFILDLRGAKNMHQKLSSRFKNFRVGLVHGRMKHLEQEKVMTDFKKGKVDILVATSVLEVGIDNPNATVLVIEHAERFGLSQLHQLRGRIGRGKYQSYCLLIAAPQSREAIARIKVITASNDGFRIAEEDLKIRGPGEFFGKRQHGLTELRIANPITQMHLLKQARDEAVRLIRKDPSLSLRQNVAIKEILKRRFPEYEELILVG